MIEPQTVIERIRDFSHDLDFLYKEAQEARTEFLEPFNLESLRDKHSYSDKVLINEGGQKLIYKCLDLKTDREVARAELSPKCSSEDQSSFLREARLMARLQHPNIMPIYDIGMEDEQAYFTMKLVDENSFDDLLKKGGDLRDLLEIYLKVCDAITYAHSKGVIHRDLKPANIQVSNFNEVLVCDWGLAQIIDENAAAEFNKYSLNSQDLNQNTLNGFIKGTPGFIAPEQVKGVRSTSCDIYSLGAILYNILTLEVPFSEAATLDEYLKIINAKPATLKNKKGVPRGLEAICLKALETDPHKRYAKVETMGAEIRAWLNGFAPLAEQAGFTKQLQLLYKRHKALCISLIAFLFILFSISAVFINSLRKSEALAKVSEKEANEARDESASLLKDLRKEQEFREGVSGDIALDYLQKSKPLFLTGTRPRVDLGLEYINISLQMNESNKEAWMIKGLLHFIRQDFTEAIECLKRSNSGKYKNIIELSRAYTEASTPLNLDQFISLNQKVQQEQGTHLAGVMRYYELKREKPLEEQIALSQRLLKMQNEHLKDIFYIFDAETMSLDLSANKKLESIYALQFLPVKNLNLSNTSIDNLIGLRGIPIEKLDISHTAVRKISHIETKDLRVLNVAYTRIQDIKPLHRSYLVELDIRGLNGINLNVVKNCRLLKKLIILPGQFKPDQLSALPESIKIITQP